MTLSASDVDVLTKTWPVVGRYSLRTQTEDFILEAQVQAGRLSEPLRRSLLSFRRFGHASGAMLIRGVPTGYVPPTPGVPGSSGSTLRATASMSVLLAGLGDQYGFRPELGGEIVQDIVPVRGFETEQISLSSTVDLTAHVEMAFSPFRSDYVALLCVRQDHDRQAGTTLSSIDTMMPLLDTTTKAVLSEPRFRTRVDRSFLIADRRIGDVWVDPICVFGGSTWRPRLRVDFGETEGKDPVARQALAALLDGATRTRIMVRLRAGDLLIVDNNRAVHGRTPFAARHDGNDRWVLRSFVTRDLGCSERVRPGDSRIVEPDYDPGVTPPPTSPPAPRSSNRRSSPDRPG